MRNLLLIFLFLVSIVHGQTLTTPTSQNIPVGVNGLPISGFSLNGYNPSTTYKVSLSITGNANSNFTVNTTTGLTRDFGFNSWVNLTSVNFSGTPTNIQNGLNSITFNTTNSIDGLINLSVLISSQVTGMYYNPTNGHMYKSVTASVDYVTAKSLASQSTFDGVQGYLVTITSQDEQDFIVQKTSQNNIWFALDDIVQEGYWTISAGPEAGTLIKTANGQFNGNISGQYNNWCSGEPNNSGNEDAAVTKWGGGGCWNDLPHTGYPGGGYVIEYGDWTDPTQSTFNSTQNVQITFTQKDMLWVDYTFNFSNNINPTDFSGMMYYEQLQNTWGTSNTQPLPLNSLGKVNTTNQIQETVLGKKSTTVGGSVEWCVVYGYDTTNQRYRVGIDKREFENTGVSPQDVTKLQLFDLWNGDVTFKSEDMYWGEYWIYTPNQFDFVNSNYSSYIRQGTGFWGLKAEFSFEDSTGYKPQSFIFQSPSQQTIQTMIDDIVTVSDVVLAFNELTGGGLNGGLKGDLNGIQLGNGDVNGDNQFDFQDTYKLLQHLTGNQSLVEDTNTLVYFMKIKTTNDYNTTTPSNWTSKYNGTTLMANVSLDNGLVVFPQYSVTWRGDVNLSHSPTQNLQVQSMKMNRLSLSKSTNSEMVEISLDIDKQDNILVVSVSIPNNGKSIAGSQFRLVYDYDKVQYLKTEYSNPIIRNYSTDRIGYINVGSISINGTENLNNGIEYKVFFKLNQNIENTLGLVSLIKTELVTSKGELIQSIIR